MNIFYRTKHTLLCIFLIIIQQSQFAKCIEPITMGVVVGLGALGYNYFKKPFCSYTECCDDRSIPGDITQLHNSLKQTLYGQHIVLQHLVPALQAHFSHSKSRKPLVISFHGTPGTGKNFVADQIAKALYLNGLKSKYVHKYIGRADFPEAARTDEYKARITRDVIESIKECPRSLFIFDEVDKMPSGVFDTLSSLVDYNSYVSGADNTKAVFLFLSNTAGTHISESLGKMIHDGRLREDTKLSDFESLLQRAAYNMDGGLKRTNLIDSHVIDHYLPFLPLEKFHVVQCLEAEFKNWGRVPQKDVIKNIISKSITYDRQYGLFSTSGCKTLEKKVAVAVMST